LVNNTFEKTIIAPKFELKDDRPVHSKIGASSMHRWAKCPGSIRESEGVPHKAGAAAQIGTMAHEYSAFILEESFSKQITVGDVIETFNRQVGVYLEYVAELKKRCGVVHIEHAFDMTEIFPDLYGTSDCVAYEGSKQTLHVADYKHGEGIVVNVENNLQTSYYALGALSTLPYRPKYITMTIVQPRAYHPDGPIRSWTVPNTYFIDFEADLIAAAKETIKENAALVAGDHCIFCPAKIKCPQKQKVNVADAKKQFGFYRDPKLDFEPVEG